MADEELEGQVPPEVEQGEAGGEGEEPQDEAAPS